MKDIKPCPFCGSISELTRFDKFGFLWPSIAYIECTGNNDKENICPRPSKYIKQYWSFKKLNINKAIDEWNTRI